MRKPRDESRLRVPTMAFRTGVQQHTAQCSSFTSLPVSLLAGQSWSPLLCQPVDWLCRSNVEDHRFSGEFFFFFLLKNLNVLSVNLVTRRAVELHWTMQAIIIKGIAEVCGVYSSFSAREIDNKRMCHNVSHEEHMANACCAGPYKSQTSGNKSHHFLRYNVNSPLLYCHIFTRILFWQPFFVCFTGFFTPHQHKMRISPSRCYSAQEITA